MAPSKPRTPTPQERQDAPLRLRRNVENLIANHPFFATLVLRMPFIEDPSRKTLACDGKHFFYHPSWVMDTTADEIRAAMAKLVMACAMKHHTRRGERDYGRWQKASHEVLTPFLRDANFVDDTGGWDDCSVEEAYERVPEPEQSDDNDQSSSAPQGASGATQGASSDQPGDGDGDGQNDGQDKPQSQDPGGTGEVMDSPVPDAGEGASEEQQRALAEAARQAEEEEWDKAMHQAHAIAKAQGNMPGKLSEEIEAAHESETPWRETLRSWMTAIGTHDFTWNRGNRRFVSQGLYLPSRHSEGMPPLVFIIDTSASMNSEALADVWTEARAVVAETEPEKVVVIHADTRVHKIEEFGPHDMPETLHALGRGGTMFEPALRYVEELDITPAGIIYFTDMYAPEPNFQPPCPVLWACHGGNPAEFTFGEKLDVTPERK